MCGVIRGSPSSAGFAFFFFGGAASESSAGYFAESFKRRDANARGVSALINNPSSLSPSIPPA